MYKRSKYYPPRDQISYPYFDGNYQNIVNTIPNIQAIPTMPAYSSYSMISPHQSLFMNPSLQYIDTYGQAYIDQPYLSHHKQQLGSSSARFYQPPLISQDYGQAFVPTFGPGYLAISHKFSNVRNLFYLIDLQS
jgi:hypothetical protein